MPDTNRRRSSRHLRLLVRATRQIPVSASPHLGHPEDWGRRRARTDRQSPDHLTCYRETTSVHNRPVLSVLFRMYRRQQGPVPRPQSAASQLALFVRFFLA
jgi:hypothetical protein